MASTNENDLEQRVSRIEQSLASMQATIEAMGHPRVENAASARPQRENARPDFGFNPPPAPSSTPRSASRTPATPPAHATSAKSAQSGIASWFTARSAEWWLGALGVVFLVIGMFLLYRYAVEHNWITPFVRVLTGVAVGAGLLAAGMRRTQQNADAPNQPISLREIFIGGAIAVWYITSYAAAVLYHLVPLSGARFSFAVLSIFAGWLALKERRILYALVAVGVGFYAPGLLASPGQSLIELATYVTALGALGIVLYLMRGWQAVLWITFFGFWATLAAAQVRSGYLRYSATSAVLTIVIVGFAAAFTRVPLMRRGLLATGSDRYAGSKTPDKVAVWVITLASPMIMLALLASVWLRAASELWSLISIALAAGAFVLSQESDESRLGITEIELTAAVLWSLAGVLFLFGSLASRMGIRADAVPVAVGALHAGLAILVIRNLAMTVPRAWAKITALVAFLATFAYELTVWGAPAGISGRAVRWDWIVAESIVIAVLAWFWISLRRGSDPDRGIAPVYGIGAYALLLLVLANVMGIIWPPLITVSYAVCGAALLLLSRRGEGRGALLKLGGLTMIIVVGRLVLIDLSAVETIWRVLLFLACGMVFVVTSYKMRAPATA
jgi:Predicted membrane protein (DUF2339)